MNNLSAASPQRLSEEHFDLLLERGRVRIERIVSRGHSSPETGWYDQEQNEWVIVIRGRAGIQFDNGNKVELGVGDYVNIPAHVKHRVEWTDKNSVTIWLAVFY